MEKKQSLRRCWWAAVAVVASVAALCGCPELGNPVLNVSTTELGFGLTRSALTVDVTNGGTGTLVWTVVSKVAWLSVEPASGVNDAGETASVTVTVLRAELPTGENTATFTISSIGGGSARISVTATAGTGLQSPYWPIEVGNVWNFSVPSFAELYPDKSASGVLSLAVMDRLVVNDLEVWKVGVSSPLLDAVLSVGGLFLDSGFLDFFTAIKTGSPSIPGPTTVTGYVVAVEGEWYVASNEAVLENLPDTNGFLPLDDVLKTPAYALHLLYTGRGQTLAEDIGSVMETLSTDLSDYWDGQETTPTPDDAAAVWGNLGSSFTGYTNQSPVLTGLVRTLAGLAAASDEVQTFRDGLDEIIDGLEERFQQFEDPLPDYMDTLEASPELLAPLFTAFGGDFSTYANNNVVLTDVMAVLSTWATGTGDLLSDWPDFTEDDLEAMGELMYYASRFCSVYGRTALRDFPRFCDAYEDYLASYPADSPAVAAMIAVSQDVFENLEVLVADVTSESRARAQVTDILALQNALHAFFAAYSEAHADDVLAAFLAEATQVSVESVTLMLDLQPVINDFRTNTAQLADASLNFTPEDRDLDNGKQLLADLAQYCETYSAAYAEAQPGEVVLATALGMILRAGEDAVDLLVALDSELNQLNITERTGALSDLVPIDHRDFTVHLADFGVDDQPDCIATGLSITFPPEPPAADFTYANEYGTPTVEFTDASAAGDEAITSWAWDFGDGTTSAEQSPTHVYAAPGYYTVSLTVTTSVGSDTSSMGFYIYIEVPEPPYASFYVDKEEGTLTALFADESSPGDEPITSWDWNFGDDATSAEQNPSHLYAAAGTYTVTLTVTTSAGSNTRTCDVSIDEYSIDWYCDDKAGAKDGPASSVAKAGRTVWIPTTICARGIGPVLFGGIFPLESASVGGAIYMGR